MRNILGLVVNNSGLVWVWAWVNRRFFTLSDFGPLGFPGFLPGSGQGFDRVLLSHFNSRAGLSSSCVPGFATTSTGPIFVTTSLKRRDGYESSC